MQVDNKLSQSANLTLTSLRQRFPRRRSRHLDGLCLRAAGRLSRESPPRAAQPPVDYLECTVDVLFERCMRIQGDGGFPGRGLLQSFELAFKQACRHEMPTTIVEADLRIVWTGAEIHQKQVIVLREKSAPIRRFQCRAGDHGGGSRVRRTP